MRNTLTVYWQFDWMELPRAPDDMLYFHARYRQEFPAKPFSPYVIFDGRGEGHYVGTVFSIQCSYGSWFGESDDRFYIDGEAEPSIVGTGCEDFFNDAWNLRLFTNANTGVTIKEPNGEDCRFTAYRWHIQAPVTFRKSLEGGNRTSQFRRRHEPGDGRNANLRFQVPAGLLFLRRVLVPEDGRRAFGCVPAGRAAGQPGDLPRNRRDLAPEIRRSPGVTAKRHSNRVCNLKQALYVDNSSVGGWFEVPCRVDQAGPYSISVFQCLYRTGGIWKVTLVGPGGEILLDPRMDFYDPYLAWKENRPENFLYGTWFEKKVGIHKLAAGRLRVSLRVRRSESAVPRG